MPQQPNDPISQIRLTLLAPERRRLKANIDRLVQLHMKELPSTLPGFIYGGIVYRHSNAPRGKIHFVALAKSLEHEMERHLADEKAAETEVQSMIQALFPALKGCRSLQDIRDVLPECLATCFSNVEGLPRTREAGWTLDQDSRAWRQFTKVLPLIEAQTAARFLY